MHIPGLAADESFVGFHLTRKLANGSLSEGESDAMVHEPSGLLRNTDSAMDFIGTHTVFAVHNLPHRHQPLIQAQRRVFEYGPGLCSELAVLMAGAALPAVIFLQKRYVLGAATRAFNAIRPTACHDILTAVFRIREVNDCFLKSAEYRLHELSMPDEM